MSNTIGLKENIYYHCPVFYTKFLMLFKRTNYQEQTVFKRFS